MTVISRGVDCFFYCDIIWLIKFVSEREMINNSSIFIEGDYSSDSQSQTEQLMLVFSKKWYFDKFEELVAENTIRHAIKELKNIVLEDKKEIYSSDNVEELVELVELCEKNLPAIDFISGLKELCDKDTKDTKDTRALLNDILFLHDLLNRAEAGSHSVLIEDMIKVNLSCSLKVIALYAENNITVEQFIEGVRSCYKDNKGIQAMLSNNIENSYKEEVKMGQEPKVLDSNKDVPQDKRDNTKRNFAIAGLVVGDVILGGCSFLGFRQVFASKICASFVSNEVEKNVLSLISSIVIVAVVTTIIAVLVDKHMNQKEEKLSI